VPQDALSYRIGLLDFSFTMLALHGRTEFARRPKQKREVSVHFAPDKEPAIIARWCVCYLVKSIFLACKKNPKELTCSTAARRWAVRVCFSAASHKTGQLFRFTPRTVPRGKNLEAVSAVSHCMLRQAAYHFCKQVIFRAWSRWIDCPSSGNSNGCDTLWLAEFAACSCARPCKRTQ
jgi:hypothetical protein